MAKNIISGKKENKKTERITIRVTSKEKEKLTKAAKKQNMNLSEYMVNVGLNRKLISNKNNTGLCDLITIQEMYNYIECNYGCDRNLERMCNQVWANQS